jgi:hypothetical protein
LSKGELFCQNTVPVTDLISQEELEIVILMWNFLTFKCL